MGPGPSGTTMAITDNPGKEVRVLRRRLGEVHANMQPPSTASDSSPRRAMTLRVGISAAPFRPDGVEFVRQAERLGVDSVWCAEFWAGDAFTPLAYLAARTSTTIRLGSGIVQLGARTPAMLAMSALSLQALSGGRFVLGIGTSGPQVMEGWHGVRFDKPVRRTRETIEIIRSHHRRRTARVPRRDLRAAAPRTARAAPSAR